MRPLPDAGSATRPARSRARRRGRTSARSTSPSRAPASRGSGCRQAALAMFSNEFVAGMTTAHRSRILGDLDENSPERWEWGSPSGPRIDLALLLYARDAAGLQPVRGRADPPARGRRARAASPSGHVGPRRLRALRLPRRDLAAGRRGPLEDGPARDDRPRRGVRPRLPERVRPVHRPAAARPRRRPAERCCRATPRAPAAPTSGATAATSSSASCARTCPGSGATSTG